MVWYTLRYYGDKVMSCDDSGLKLMAKRVSEYGNCEVHILTETKPLRAATMRFPKFDREERVVYFRRYSGYSIGEILSVLAGGKK